MFRDFLRKERLRECRFVAFVVAITAVAHEVDQEISPESRTILPGHARSFDACDRVVCVDVHDRNLKPRARPLA